MAERLTIASTPLAPYEQFIQAKRPALIPTGFTPSDINPMLFPFQRDIVTWACKRGRACILLDCGLGKTPIQLEWARLVADHADGPVLILAPLSVSLQTQREGVKFGIPVTVCRSQADVIDGVNITNYEMLHHFDPAAFVGVVLDESSILKAHDGKTRSRIIESFSDTAYKLACTATPAPNDHMELGNHAEFMGVMSRTEMLSMFFVHDGGDTSQWRLKQHGETAFWEWVASWAVLMRRPSDLGYDDDGFVLPALNVHRYRGESELVADNALFAAAPDTLLEQLRTRRATIQHRVGALIDAITSSTNTDQWLVWCDLNSEQDAVADACKAEDITVSSIQGTTPDCDKLRLEEEWRLGKRRVLVTKPTVFGFGMNWQHCRKMAFVGMSHSYEQYYQAIRRCWRFGQPRAVDVHIFTTEQDDVVVENVMRKEQQAIRMAETMVASTRNVTSAEIRNTERTTNGYHTDDASSAKWRMMLGDCVERIRELNDDQIDYTIFSPPFASLYTYSNSERDMGNCKDDAEFAEHFAYLVPQLLRVTRPGRLLSFHCMNLPTSKERDGVIGIRDFRGELIRAFTDAGWIFHSEVCIWKDPVTAMQRTKALGLLHKQLKKDSTMSRQGIPDYIVTMRKPGVNDKPVSHTNETFPVALWQRYASPVWMDINPSKTLQYRMAKDADDERHICPLQLEVIERCVDLWTADGDTVLSPFAGIGSEGYVAVQRHRQFIGIELKRSYYDAACRNLAHAEMLATARTLF